MRFIQWTIVKQSWHNRIFKICICDECHIEHETGGAVFQLVASRRSSAYVLFMVATICKSCDIIKMLFADDKRKNIFRIKQNISDQLPFM